MSAHADELNGFGSNAVVSGPDWSRDTNHHLLAYRIPQATGTVRVESRSSAGAFRCAIDLPSPAGATDVSAPSLAVENLFASFNLGTTADPDWRVYRRSHSLYTDPCENTWSSWTEMSLPSGLRAISAPGAVDVPIGMNERWTYVFVTVEDSFGYSSLLYNVKTGGGWQSWQLVPLDPMHPGTLPSVALWRGKLWVLVGSNYGFVLHQATMGSNGALSFAFYDFVNGLSPVTACSVQATTPFTGGYLFIACRVDDTNPYVVRRLLDDKWNYTPWEAISGSGGTSFPAFGFRRSYRSSELMVLSESTVVVSYLKPTGPGFDYEGTLYRSDMDASYGFGPWSSFILY